MNGYGDATTLSTGLLIARVVVGSLMAAHGAQKLFGWFGGHGLTATAGFFDAMGFRPGRLFAVTASFTEFASGLLIVLGLFGPVGPALMLSVMIVAATTVHWQHGIFASANGIEVPLLYGTAALAQGLVGPGMYSLDAVFGLEALWAPNVAWILLALGAVGGIANVLLRRPITQHA